MFVEPRKQQYMRKCLLCASISYALYNGLVGSFVELI